MSKQNKIDQPKSLAARRAELDAILHELESSEVPIEQITDRLKTAANLAEAIERDLRDQKASIEVLKKRFDSEA